VYISHTNTIFKGLQLHNLLVKIFESKKKDTERGIQPSPTSKTIWKVLL
jgi:hypothetical protein